MYYLFLKSLHLLQTIQPACLVGLCYFVLPWPYVRPVWPLANFQRYFALLIHSKSYPIWAVGIHCLSTQCFFPDLACMLVLIGCVVCAGCIGCVVQLYVLRLPALSTCLCSCFCVLLVFLCCAALCSCFTYACTGAVSTAVCTWCPTYAAQTFSSAC